MNIPVFKEYSSEDIPQLVSLWGDIFEDSESFVKGFFHFLPDMGSCLVMELAGEPAGIASVITGCELTYGRRLRSGIIGYIYALGIKKSFRGKGFGLALAKEAGSLALKHEADIVCVRPADDSLYDFYRKALGFECSLWRKRFCADASPYEMTMRLSSTEYAMFRDSMLDSGYRLHPSFFVTEYLRFISESGGGGLYASESGICCARKNGSICLIHEAVCRDSEKTASLAASVAYELGCSKAVWFQPCERQADGAERFIASLPGKIPESTVWNIAFE